MNNFTIQKNQFLSRNTDAYYHQSYTTFGADGNPDFLNRLKNQFNNANDHSLVTSANELAKILNKDFPEIKKIFSEINLTVCVVPRAKAENVYSNRQRLFRRVVSLVVDKLNEFENGTEFIIRHKDTITTHMNKSGYGGDGELPYIGITKGTCNISDDAIGKDILLIDDIYTKGVNIDEDAIQALLDKGANSVIFYAIGNANSGRIFYNPQVNDLDDLPF